MKMRMVFVGAVRERRSMMRSRSVFTAALVVAVLGSAMVASATGPRFSRHEAVATVADDGQSVKSDGGGVYADDGDTNVAISDSTDASASDSFVMSADAVGRSDRVLRLDNEALSVNTACSSGSIRVFSETDWFNGGGAPGRATLYCDAGANQPAYFIQWELCVEITGPSGGPFNFRPQETCIAKVKRFKDGPMMTVELPVPFDITASVA